MFSAYPPHIAHCVLCEPNFRPVCYEVRGQPARYLPRCRSSLIVPIVLSQPKTSSPHLRVLWLTLYRSTGSAYIQLPIPPARLYRTRSSPYLQIKASIQVIFFAGRKRISAFQGVFTAIAASSWALFFEHDSSALLSLFIFRLIAKRSI